MVISSAIAPKRKVKTGCRTCKIRRVKCDEGRPSCQRCLSTDRVCDGYGIWGGGNALQKNSKTVQQPLSIDISRAAPSSFGDTLTSDEQICLGWFRTRSMFKLPGAFVSSFWKVTLLQSSVSEPAIRHAVLALSFYHRSIVTGAEIPNFSWSLNPAETRAGDLCVTQYNKAIRCLASHFSTGDVESTRIVVITSIVFVFLDFLRGRYRLARSHLEHGVRLWKGLQSMQGARQSVALVDDWISQTLTSLQLQSVMYGQYSAISAEIFTFSSNRVDSFSFVNDAKACLDSILLGIYRLNAEHENALRSRDCDSRARRSFREDLANWLSLLLKFSTSKKLNPLGQLAIRLLKIYHVMGIILLDLQIDGTNDAVSDSHTSDFMFILEQGYNMYKIASKQNWHELRKPNFTSASRAIADIGTIPPLYFTAIHCCDPGLRLQAIKLLGSLAHKEGIWDAELAACIASRVMQIENHLVPARVISDKHKKAHANSEKMENLIACVGHNRRIRQVVVQLPDDPQGLVGVKCFVPGVDGTDLLVVSNFDLITQQWL